MDTQIMSGDGVASSANNRVEINMMDTSSRPQFVGLSKEELARYENDPYWKKVRMGLLLLFWTIWLILLVAAVLLLVRTPKCPKVYNLKWSRKYPGYAICVDKFTGGPLMMGDDTHARQMSVLTERLEYVKNMDFGQVTLYDEWLEKLDDSNIIESVVKPLRQQANSLSMMLVLEIENRNVCEKADGEEDKECENLHKLIDKVLKVYDFDGISMRVFDDADREFQPSVVKHAKKYVDAIGKSTLKPRSLIATSRQKFDEVEADLKVSSALKDWKADTSAHDLVGLIAQSKGCSAWRLDSVDGALIADNDRKLDTNFALHTVYLLPGTPIITYGTETFINSDKCSPPIMPWNATMNYTSTNPACSMQTDIESHNVKRVSANGYPNSPYRLIRELTKLRNENYIFRYGTIASLKHFNDVLYWEIHEPINPIYVVMINTKEHGQVATLDNPIFEDKENGCKLELLYQSNTSWTVNDEIPCGSVYLNGHAVVVLKSKTKLQEKDFAIENSTSPEA